MKKNKRAVGLNIGELSLRVADIETGGENVTVLHLSSFIIPSKTANPEDFKKEILHLKKLVKKLHIKRDAYISPNNKNITLKEKTLPPVKSKEIFKLIESEIKDYAIFGHENVSLGYNVISKEKDRIKILWAGLKESILMETISFVKHIGIKPVAVVPSVFGAAKFITYFYPEEESFAIINVDSSVTSITFVNNGKVVLNYKHDVGLSDIEGGEKSVINNWIGNILTTTTFVLRNKKIPVKKIFLISQYGNPKNLLPVLSERIAYPIVIPDLKLFVNFKNEEDFLQIQKTGGSEYVIPIGLALLQASGVHDPLFCDISKHILVEKASIKLKIAVTSLLLVAVNGLAVYLYPILSSTLNNLSLNLENTNKRIEIASKEAQNTENIKTELSVLIDELNRYKKLQSNLQNRNVSSKLLSELKEKLPEGVRLTNVSINETGVISIGGVGNSYKDILQYEINLTSAHFVKEASISEMAKNTAGAVLFKMTALSVNGVGNEKGK